MRAYVIPAGNESVEGLRQVELTDPPAPKGRQVLVRLRAVSLNYRDHAIVVGKYRTGPVDRDTIPLSDGAGEVVAVGEEVTGLAPGDRVMNCFAQPPLDGSARRVEMLGSPRDGVLCELALFQETGLVRIPDRFSWEEAACFPCAGATAWNALFGKGEPVRAGQTVLVLGTGGVSLFALQLARMAGAQVIVTSSSDEKLAAVLPLGVQHRINYRRFPEWQEEVLKITGGRGVDCVVEVGGTGTLGRSFQAVGENGKVMLIGVLTGGEPPNPGILMLKLASLHGIRVGSRAQFEALVAAYESNDARPVIGRRFGFDEVLDAYRVQAAGDFIGKIVIAM